MTNVFIFGRWVFAQGFGCTIVRMCNIKNANIVNELKVETKEFDKKNS